MCTQMVIDWNKLLYNQGHILNIHLNTYLPNVSVTQTLSGQYFATQS